MQEVLHDQCVYLIFDTKHKRKINIISQESPVVHRYSHSDSCQNFFLLAAENDILILLAIGKQRKFKKKTIYLSLIMVMI